MNFLGMGPGELVLIATLGLIIFGPGKLPEIAAQLGRAVRDFRRSTSEITAEFQRSLSLEEPASPAEAPAPAAPVAEQSPPASEPAPVVPDASAWHWETSESSPPAPSPAPSATSFWQWDEPESQPAAEAPATPPAAGSSALWVWDPPSAEAERNDRRADEPAERAAAVEVPPAG